MDHLLQHALKLLVARPHSRHEIRTKLIRVCERRAAGPRRVKAAVPPPPPSPSAVKADCAAVADEVLTKLAAQGLVDDQAFASFWRDQRERFRPRSALHLRGELRMRGVEAVVVEAEVRGYDDEAACKRLAAKKPRADRTSLQAFLARKGFRYETIKKVLDEEEQGTGRRGRGEGEKGASALPPSATTGKGKTQKKEEEEEEGGPVASVELHPPRRRG
jgi:SOS response regulatory protein OraA/RecX